jgi:F-type H+-transporting ATPase subunit epsilon
MSQSHLHLIVRTPRDVVFRNDASSVRVPTETGQVGIRPHVEPLVLAIEPGLVVIRLNDSYRFVGTAGGLLRSDGSEATLLTPLAVVGASEDDVIGSLEAAMAQPSVEMEARAMLGRLQSSMLRELREGKQGALGIVGERP